MKLAIINGSPRGERSNSKRIANFLTLNKNEYSELTIESFYLAKVKDQPTILERLKKFDRFVFIFPLYTDCMPGVVKKFMEDMALESEYFEGKSIAYIIHSGFPEAIQSRVLERYTKYFSAKVMHMNYLGTIIMPGSEALQMAPDNAYQGKFPYFAEAFKDLMENNPLSSEACSKLAGKEQTSKLTRLFFKIFPFINLYWYYLLRKNKAFSKRNAKPYA